MQRHNVDMLPSQPDQDTLSDFAETAARRSLNPKISRSEMKMHRSNSYDLFRFFAAAAVLFSHHFLLFAELPEPAVPLYGLDFGKLGVAIFFTLSGFLICRSLDRSTDIASFAAARLLRIFPI